MSSAPHQNSLDGARAVAVLLVLALHVAGETGLTTQPGVLALLVGHGDSGVAIFFVLSGLLLYRPWAAALFGHRSRPSTVPYLWRRVWRVVPAFWLTVAIGLFAFNREHVDELGTWLELLGMVAVYDPSPWWQGTGPTGLYHLWTIPVEMSFYAVLPLLGLVLAGCAGRRATASAVRARRVLTALALLWPCCLVYQYFTYNPEWRPQMGMWLPRSLPWFALGMALAVVAAWSAAEPEGPVRRFCVTVGSALTECWLAAGLLYVIACTELTGPWGMNFGFDDFWSSSLRILLYGAGSVLFIAPLALHPGNRHPLALFFGGRVMSRLGVVSYGIYLWHALLLLGLARVIGPWMREAPYLLVLALALAVTVPVAELSHRLLEEPVRRLGTRLTVRDRRDDRRDRGAAQQLGDLVGQDVRAPGQAHGGDRAGQPEQSGSRPG
ncbi:acyltransferase [Actinocorallia longicatena]|uniref:acyltransferase family protein n=1 Tax=Actinocorallia longicatena TaxID=111803 RepID=UPI0031D9028D